MPYNLDLATSAANTLPHTIPSLTMTQPASTSIAAEIEYIRQIAASVACSSAPDDMNELKFVCLSTIFHPELAGGKTLLVVDENGNPLFGIDPQSGALMHDDLHALSNCTREIAEIGIDKKNQGQFFARVDGEWVVITGDYAVYKAILMAVQQVTFQITDIEGEKLRDELAQRVKENHNNPAFLSLKPMIKDAMFESDEGGDYNPELGKDLQRLAEQYSFEKKTAGMFSFNPRIKEKGLLLYSVSTLFSGFDSLFHNVINGILPWHRVSSHVIPAPSGESISSSDTAYAGFWDDVEKKKLFNFTCVEERDNIVLSKILRQVGNTLKNPVDSLWKESAVVHAHNTLGIGCPSPEDVQNSEKIAKIGDEVLSFIASSIPNYGAYLTVFQNFVGTGLVLIADDMENKPLRPELAEDASANLSMFVRISFDKLPQAQKEAAKNNNNSHVPIPKGLSVNYEEVYIETNGEKYVIEEENGRFIGVNNNIKYNLDYHQDNENWTATEIENASLEEQVVCLRARRVLDGICSPGVTYPEVSAENQQRIINLKAQCSEKIKLMEAGTVNSDVRYMESIIKGNRHYAGASIYRLVDANQQTIDGTAVIDMNGHIIEITETVIPGHGIRFDAPDNLAGISHPLEWRSGWRFEEPTDNGAAKMLFKSRAVTEEMLVGGIDHHRISAPDKAGFRWDENNACYLKINNKYLPIEPNKSNYIHAFSYSDLNGVKQDYYFLNTVGRGQSTYTRNWIRCSPDILENEEFLTRLGFRSVSKKQVYGWSEATKVNPTRTEIVRKNIDNVKKIINQANDIVQKMSVSELALKLEGQYPGMVFLPDDVRAYQTDINNLVNIAEHYAENYHREISFLAGEDHSRIIHQAKDNNVVTNAFVAHENRGLDAERISKMIIVDPFFEQFSGGVSTTLIHEMTHLLKFDTQDYFYLAKRRYVHANGEARSINEQLDDFVSYSDRQLSDFTKHVDKIDNDDILLREGPALRTLIGDDARDGLKALREDHRKMVQALRTNADSLAHFIISVVNKSGKLAELNLEDTQPLLASDQAKINFPSREKNLVQ